MSRKHSRLESSSDPTAACQRPQVLIDHLRRLSTELQEIGRGFGSLHQLHPTDVRALVLIMDAGHTNDPMTPGRLGARLNLTSAAVTALVDRLERAGHVQRVRDVHDRRRVVLHIAPRTMALAADFFGQLNTDMLTALTDFNAAELAIVDRFLTRMIAVVTEPRASPAAPPADPRLHGG